MKTPTPTRQEQIRKKWFMVDAKGKVMGRLAAHVAAVLRGKHKPQFVPHADMGDHVIVVNLGEVAVTGKKADDKKYYTHSGYPGGLKEVSLKRLTAKKPLEAFRLAVRGMIPRNALRDKILMKLHLFSGSEHGHAAQKPEILDL